MYHVTLVSSEPLPEVSFKDLGVEPEVTEATWNYVSLCLGTTKAYNLKIATFTGRISSKDLIRWAEETSRGGIEVQILRKKGKKVFFVRGISGLAMPIPSIDFESWALSTYQVWTRNRVAAAKVCEDREAYLTGMRLGCIWSSGDLEVVERYL